MSANPAWVADGRLAMNRGIHHVGLATHDMEATLDFYENVLGFPAVVCETIEPQVGGTIRHAFFDAGEGALMAFMEVNDVPGIAADFDAGINRGLGTEPGMFHFAFAVADEADLNQRRADLESKGVTVRGVIDHGWCKSIYFRDPNRLQLEFSHLTGPLDESHRAGRFGELWQRLARR